MLLAGGRNNPNIINEREVNALNSIATKTCKKCFDLNALLKSNNSINTKNAWNAALVYPISKPVIRLIA